MATMKPMVKKPMAAKKVPSYQKFAKKPTGLRPMKKA